MPRMARSSLSSDIPIVLRPRHQRGRTVLPKKQTDKDVGAKLPWSYP